MGEVTSYTKVRIDEMVANVPLWVPWSLNGDVVVGESNDWDFEALESFNLIYLRLRLGTAGTTSTVVSIRRNGVELTTVTLAAGNLTQISTVAYTFVASDTYSVAVTSAGAGAKDLLVKAKFTPQ